MLYKPFKYNLSVDNPVRMYDRNCVDKPTEGLAKYVLRALGALLGDVLFIGSVSGKTTNVIVLALCRKEFGLYVIALTFLEYSSNVISNAYALELRY